MDAHRHAVAPHDRRQRPRADDRIDVQMHLRLVAAQRRRRLLPHVAVERARVHPSPREQELQHRHVPAEVAAPQNPRAEERLAERAEREARAGVRRADRQPVRALERVHRGRRARACDPVDLREVETVRAQGDLQPGDLRVDAGVNGRDGRQRSDGDDERDASDARERTLRAAPPGSSPPYARFTRRTTGTASISTISTTPEEEGGRAGVFAVSRAGAARRDPAGTRSAARRAPPPRSSRTARRQRRRAGSSESWTGNAPGLDVQRR